MSKNRKKRANLSAATLSVVILTAFSLGATGVMHTVIKNQQLEVVRETELVERRIKEHERDVTNLEIRLGQLSNRFDLRERLITQGTDLRRIGPGVIEDISALGAVPELASSE
ncbi:MAG: hypothetical protein AAGC74_03190 [Verrucomicrobiota bacterium]